MTSFGNAPVAKAPVIALRRWWFIRDGVAARILSAGGWIWLVDGVQAIGLGAED